MPRKLPIPAAPAQQGQDWLLYMTQPSSAHTSSADLSCAIVATLGVESVESVAWAVVTGRPGRPESYVWRPSLAGGAAV